MGSGDGVKEKKTKKKKKRAKYHDDIMTESEVNTVLVCFFIFLNLHYGCR